MSSVPEQFRDADIRETDILVGRGKNYTDHIGTIAFKALVDANIGTYMDEAAESCDKTFVIVETIEAIRKHGGRFLRETKKCSGIWVEISRQEAHTKVRHTFRDASANQKRKTSRDLLAKANSSVRFESNSTFKEIVSKISQDPAVGRFLKTSKEMQHSKSAKLRRRESKIAAERRDELQFQESPLLCSLPRPHGCCALHQISASSEGDKLALALVNQKEYSTPAASTRRYMISPEPDSVRISPVVAKFVSQEERCHYAQQKKIFDSCLNETDPLHGPSSRSTSSDLQERQRQDKMGLCIPRRSDYFFREVVTGENNRKVDLLETLQRAVAIDERAPGNPSIRDAELENDELLLRQLDDFVKEDSEFFVRDMIDMDEDSHEGVPNLTAFL